MWNDLPTYLAAMLRSEGYLKSFLDQKKSCFTKSIYNMNDLKGKLQAFQLQIAGKTEARVSVPMILSEVTQWLDGTSETSISRDQTSKGGIRI